MMSSYNPCPFCGGEEQHSKSCATLRRDSFGNRLARPELLSGVKLGKDLRAAFEKVVADAKPGAVVPVPEGIDIRDIKPKFGIPISPPYEGYAPEADQDGRTSVKEAFDEIDAKLLRMSGFLRSDEPGGGVKDDVGKDPWHLMPVDAMAAIVKVLAFGARKYDERNWERGMLWSRCYSALLRHLTAWWSGEKSDDETGYSHLWHAGCCVLFLISFEIRGSGTDDRPSVRK